MSSDEPTTSPTIDDPETLRVLGPDLAAALERKGYTSLTQVQEAVLDPELAGRDLRITSQTGSGKTVAVGFTLREIVAAAPKKPELGPARPRALVVAPTRELAKQVESELAWLFAPLGARVVSVTGGASFLAERRALGSGPAVVVGTPGRLLDHLEKGSIDAASLKAVVLDEADRMLDLGFKEELDAILDKTPEDRITHLMSATFPRDVRALADRVQRDPVIVEGTPLGAANADIEHLIYMVDPRDRVGAIINLLLANPNEQTLIFARTRADVAELTLELSRAGFGVMSLSGEMEQRDRDRALRAFRAGELRALVATDVAARGIDVQDIAMVLHAEPPTDADTYTHRSGRTGRAGKKGRSAVLVAPAARDRAIALLRRAGVRHRIETVPTAKSIRAAQDEELTRALLADDSENGPSYDEATWALAERLAQGDQVVRTIARLLSGGHVKATVAPREVRAIEAPIERAPRTLPPPRARGRVTREAPSAPHEGFVPFRVSWGSVHGADARRLLAVACRRGDIRGSDVGAIHVGRSFSIVEVKAAVAAGFERAASAADPRDPKIKITRGASAHEAPREKHASGGHSPPRKKTPGFRGRR